MSEAVAVIDMGSNSIKLLVARLEADGRIESLLTETVEKRISGGISKELPQLSPDAMRMAVETVSELVELANNFNPANRRDKRRARCPQRCRTHRRHQRRDRHHNASPLRH